MKFLSVILVLFVSGIAAQSQVGINTQSPHASAQLEIQSTSKGILIPRMTAAQRALIASPANGLLVFQTDASTGFYFNAGTPQSPMWTLVGANNGAGGSFNLPYVGTSGAAEAFKVSNTSSGFAMAAHSDMGSAIRASAYGNGHGLVVSTDRGSGLHAITNDTGYAVYGMSHRGNAAKFEITNSANPSPAVHIKSNAPAPALKLLSNQQTKLTTALEVTNSGWGQAIVARTSSNASNGIESITEGPNSYAIYAHSEKYDGIVGATSNPARAAVLGMGFEGGYGIQGWSKNGGVGVLGQSGVTADPTTIAGRFECINNFNTNDVLQVRTAFAATNNLVKFMRGDASVARIDYNGKAFFNGGTQNSGADVAEAFAVEGSTNEYEPGDVLVVSTKSDRTVEKSSEAYSSLVLGVYATRPGVLLTEDDVDAALSNKVPMGVVGVIPTKVCNEGGAIKRGDLLVTASRAGYAMKADPKKVKTGQVIGKALENAEGDGLIRVMVNVK